MSQHKYWVIGGKYGDLNFEKLTGELPTIAGPFNCEEEAKSEWKRLSFERRASATTRFSIVRERAAGREGEFHEQR
jgi:hypothetical protein